jgi:hypothetical protein
MHMSLHVLTCLFPKLVGLIIWYSLRYLNMSSCYQVECMYWSCIFVHIRTDFRQTLYLIFLFKDKKIYESLELEWQNTERTSWREKTYCSEARGTCGDRRVACFDRLASTHVSCPKGRPTLLLQYSSPGKNLRALNTTTMKIFPY